MNKRLIVTNHSNHDLSWLKELEEYGFARNNIFIYDRSPTVSPEVEKLGKLSISPNVGSNIYDYGKYILENYDNLPDINIFIKGNITWRTYTTRERFLYALKSNWFVPIDNDPIGSGVSNYYEPWGEGFYVNDCSHLEKVERHSNDNENLKVYPRIKNFKDFLEDLFVIKKIPEYIAFCPGANFVVPKQNILKYSTNFYKKMMYYTDYDSNPIEAHYWERVLLMAWNGSLLENMNFVVPENYNG